MKLNQFSPNYSVYIDAERVLACFTDRDDAILLAVTLSMGGFKSVFVYDNRSKMIVDEYVRGQVVYIVDQMALA